jgi:hypothetical protein
MTKTGIWQPLAMGLAVFMTLPIVVSSHSFAGDRSVRIEVPASLAVAITIDSEHLIELYQSLPELKIIDSRYRESHIQGYIETSHNLPLVKIDCAALSKLVGSKDQAMAFYCNGNSADASIETIQVASICGYQRLSWFRGEFIEWKDKDYPCLIE